MKLAEYLNRPDRKVGEQASLAKKLGIAPALLSQWKSGDRPIPAERCPEIERATGGQVRCEDLRPDVAWEVLRAQSTTTQEAVHG